MTCKGFGLKCFVVMSGSMEPEISTGSLCIVSEAIGFDEVNVGDIIAFNTGMETLVTHRVIDMTEDGLMTKGDANETGDHGPVTEENYEGKTIGSIPYAGYAVHFLQQSKGLLFVLILIFLVLSMGERKREPDKALK